MANGRYATAFEELDITPPAGGVLANNEDGGQSLAYKFFYCRIQHGSGDVVYCAGSDSGYYRIQLGNGAARRRLCYVSSSDAQKDLKEKMCKSLGGTLIDDGASDWLRYELP